MTQAMTFGQQLREWRRRRFLTQKDLAKQIPVTWQTVSRWESGQGIPYPATQRRLIEVLGITPEEFFAALDARKDATLEGKAAA